MIDLIANTLLLNNIKSKLILIEAPTGIGKTLGYLIPIVHYKEVKLKKKQTVYFESGEYYTVYFKEDDKFKEKQERQEEQEGLKIIISTYTKGLQDQVKNEIEGKINKIIKETHNKRYKPISGGVLQGRDNYLCLNNFDDFYEEVKSKIENIKEEDGKKKYEKHEKVLKAIKQIISDEEKSANFEGELIKLLNLLSYCGEISNIINEDDQLRKELEDRLAINNSCDKNYRENVCPFYKDRKCYYYNKLKEELKKKDVIIVNHVLLPYSRYNLDRLEEYILIADEGHSLSKGLILAYTKDLSLESIRRDLVEKRNILKDLKESLEKKKFSEENTQELLEILEDSINILDKKVQNIETIFEDIARLFIFNVFNDNEKFVSGEFLFDFYINRLIHSKEEYFEIILRKTINFHKEFIFKFKEILKSYLEAIESYECVIFYIITEIYGKNLPDNFKSFINSYSFMGIKEKAGDFECKPPIFFINSVENINENLDIFVNEFFNKFLKNLGLILEKIFETNKKWKNLLSMKKLSQNILNEHFIREQNQYNEVTKKDIEEKILQFLKNREGEGIRGTIMDHDLKELNIKRIGVLKYIKADMEKLEEKLYLSDFLRKLLQKYTLSRKKIELMKFLIKTLLEKPKELGFKVNINYNYKDKKLHNFIFEVFPIFP
ncbi:MAG: hypothetical protein NC925_04435, partial [Candidatus Omnitrophica bacterium]|nr:hypothetical protein [Candidatus Omnitrophota bacterium]